jgi:ABC-type transport system involved in multi-copper enzyme maturation permease subunit
MTFLPVVARELRVLSTLTRVQWVRVALAGFAILACLQWSVLRLGSAAGTAAPGLEAFHMLTWLGFVVAVGAVILTADCVSKERREGTLGLLFLTSLKSRDVLLGKFAALGTLAIYTLLGFAPVLMVPVLFGGVTPGEIVRVALVLLNVMFVALAAGLFVSVFARSQFSAILRSFTLLLALNGLPFFIQTMMPAGLPFPGLFSPVFAFLAGQEQASAATASGFWWSLAAGHLEGWLLIAMAVFGLARNWRHVHLERGRRRAAPEGRRLLAAPRVLVQGRENRRRVFAPVARAVLRLHGLRGMAWLGAVISLAGALGNAFVMNRLASPWAAASFTIVFSFASSALFALVGGQFLFDAKRSGELELLLVTPVGARGILREQRLALLRILRAPLMAVIVGGIVVAVSSVREFAGMELVGLLFGGCQLANAVFGALAVARVGMWFALRANSVIGIVGWTVGLVEVAPIALAYLLPVLLADPRVFAFWPLFVPVGLLLKNLFFLRWAGVRLQAEFRGRTS